MKNPLVVEEISVRYQDLDPYGHVNNALHLAYFEAARLAYWDLLAQNLGLGPLEAGDIPGMRYVIAEATVRYRAPIFFGDALYGAVSIRTVTNRSFTMDYELRAGESYETGRTAAEGTSVQVFYNLETHEVRPRPEWFLTGVASIEGRTEDSLMSPSNQAG